MAKAGHGTYCRIIRLNDKYVCDACNEQWTSGELGTADCPLEVCDSDPAKGAAIGILAGLVFLALFGAWIVKLFV